MLSMIYDFSFDPDNDPLCVLLMIDFYALRSEQYVFLVHLFEEWESHRNLSLLPNFAFSVSLAMYHMSTNGEYNMERADEMVSQPNRFSTKTWRWLW